MEATWVVDEILLVILLGVPPVLKGHNLRDDGVLDLGLLQLVLHLIGLALLLRIMVEDRTPARNVLRC